MLTTLDESLLHQAAATFAAAVTSDHRFYDRCFLSFADPERRAVVGVTIGVYKNMNVTDAGVAVVGGTVQHNVRASRALRPLHTPHIVGPIHYEVLEPMRRLRLQLAPGPYPTAFDVQWHSRIDPFLEGETVQYVNGRLATHVQRYDQAGEADGWLEIEGNRVSVRSWYGVRDHSWGVRRDVGGFEPMTGATASTDAGYLIIWLVFRIDDCAGYLQVWQDGDGRSTKMEGMLRWTAGSGREDARVVAFEDDVEFQPGTRNYMRARFKLRTHEGSEWVIEAERLGAPIVMRGTGYERGFDDGKGLGVFRGEQHLEFDSYDVAADPQVHKLGSGEAVHSLQREQIVTVRLNGKAGHGDLTILPFGAIPRYGLRALDAKERQIVKLNESG
ncbi:MAG: hypothetical protein ABW034_11545 [Steroidobacteraceae bacterium]